LIQKQWEALPNYVGDANILPLVDVSGSMCTPAGGRGSKSQLTCLEVAVSLGLYLADKNTGKFKDTFLTFSGKPELLNLKGNINQKINQMIKSDWCMNTDLVAAFKKILDVAVKGNVPQEEMPAMVMILSDMQFDACVHYDDGALQGIERSYKVAGYNLPKVVFWNLNARAGNVPVKHDKKVMVWGCMTAYGVWALHRIVGIMKKEMYQNILETEFQRSAQMLFPDGNYLFQQDNDPKHTAGVVQNYIRQSSIPLLDNWPAQSPDLNPIENLWAILDLKLQSRKPNTEAELFEQLQIT
jgi:transposase